MDAAAFDGFEVMIERGKGLLPLRRGRVIAAQKENGVRIEAKEGFCGDASPGSGIGGEGVSAASLGERREKGVILGGVKLLHAGVGDIDNEKHVDGGGGVVSFYDGVQCALERPRGSVALLGGMEQDAKGFKGFVDAREGVHGMGIHGDLEFLEFCDELDVCRMDEDERGGERNHLFDGSWGGKRRDAFCGFRPGRVERGPDELGMRINGEGGGCQGGRERDDARMGFLRRRVVATGQKHPKKYQKKAERKTAETHAYSLKDAFFMIHDT